MGRHTKMANRCAVLRAASRARAAAVHASCWSQEGIHPGAYGGALAVGGGTGNAHCAAGFCAR
jgi:hypothetical protein